MIAARRPPASDQVKKFLRPSAIGRMARSAALLLILRQPPRQSASRGATGVFSLRFFLRGFLLAPQIRAKPGMPAWARRRRPALRRRGLVHACRIVIQNRREPARDLRDAHAAGVRSPFPDWVRRSQLVHRWHPDHRHYEEPCGKQSNDAYEYPTFFCHFPPPLLNRRPPDDPISRLRLPLRTRIGKTEPSP
jgi:hypothetical protein